MQCHNPRIIQDAFLSKSQIIQTENQWKNIFTLLYGPTKLSKHRKKTFGLTGSGYTLLLGHTENSSA